MPNGPDIPLQLKEETFTGQDLPPNLAKNLKEELLQTIGNAVVEDYKRDLGSRAELDKRLKTWYRLFSGLTDPKNHPWQDSSNVTLPVLSIACHQSHSRSYEALLPPKEIAKCLSTDGTAVNVAARRQRFLNWQLTKQMKEWKRDQDVMLLLLPIYGGGVKKTYYDHTLKRPVSRTLRQDEFVAPYGVKNLDDAPRKTHIIEMSVNDIKIKGKFGGWINTDDINVESSRSVLDKPAEEYRESSDKVTGISPSTDTKDNPRIVLEQHRLWDLDDDGIEEPYCITVDKDTGKVFSIQSLEYIDPTTNERKPYSYFTAYYFMPNPDSWMGFGFGHILEHLNRAMNSLTNQLVDAGTLANTAGGFINGNRNIKIGKFKFKMGQFTRVDLPSDDIRKSIYPFQFQQPSNVLYTLLNMFQEYAQKVSSVSDSMLGEVPPSDTAATTILAVMEQGMKVFSTIFGRIHSSFQEELEKIETLNFLYVDDAIYRSVQNSTAPEMEGFTSAYDDYDVENRIDVVPVSDPSITSRVEKLIKAQKAYDTGIANPRIASDPEAMYVLTKELYRALEMQNIDEIVKKPEPEPPPPDLRPEEEEAEFLAERAVAPLPTQDHRDHLESHQIFKEVMAAQPKGEEGAEAGAIELSSQGKKLLDGHIRETMALLYLQQHRETVQQGGIPNVGGELGSGIPVGGGAGGGYAGVGEQPVYEGVPADIGVGEGLT
jgi:chaperonin GroES